jgi:hypothetical protein
MLHPFEPAVRAVVHLLVRREYHVIESLTGGSRLAAAEIEDAVSAYPATLVLPPSWADVPLDVVALEGVDPPGWAVVIPMWTREEGLSDLSLELTVFSDGAGYRIELDDLHVL